MSKLLTLRASRCILMAMKMFSHFKTAIGYNYVLAVGTTHQHCPATSLRRLHHVTITSLIPRPLPCSFPTCFFCEQHWKAGMAWDKATINMTLLTYQNVAKLEPLGLWYNQVTCKWVNPHVDWHIMHVHIKHYMCKCAADPGQLAVCKWHLVYHA